MYVCTYEWHLLSIRREDEILSFTMQFSVFFLHWPGVYAVHVQ